MRRRSRARTALLLACIGISLTPIAARAAGPVVTGIGQSRGAVGSIVSISGSGLSDASTVSFGGMPAQFTVGSDAQISAAVPSGSLTGPITITTPEGNAISSPFTVSAEHRADPHR